MSTGTAERPILFSAPMVRAILEGRKTQTRRVVKPIPELEQEPDTVLSNWSWGNGRNANGDPNSLADAQRYGSPGDRLWVRETWNAGNPAHPSGIGIMFDEKPREGMKLVYRADPESETYVPEIPWRSPIHMPRWASRITLEIAEVWVQRLQEIGEEDCRAEGICLLKTNCDGECGQTPCGISRQPFMTLWDSINGKKHPWESNPWVWAVTFNRVEA
jgi:hypothetical protein